MTALGPSWLLAERTAGSSVRIGLLLLFVDFMVPRLCRGGRNNAGVVPKLAIEFRRSHFVALGDPKSERRAQAALLIGRVLARTRHVRSVAGEWDGRACLLTNRVADALAF